MIGIVISFVMVNRTGSAQRDTGTSVARNFVFDGTQATTGFCQHAQI